MRLSHQLFTVTVSEIDILVEDAAMWIAHAAPSVHRARSMDWNALTPAEQKQVQQFEQHDIEPKSTRAQVYIHRHIMGQTS